MEGVVGDNMLWDSPVGYMSRYSFSFRNKLSVAVKDIHCLVVFYKSEWVWVEGHIRDLGGTNIEYIPGHYARMEQQLEPVTIDFDLVKYSGIIPAGLAKRVQGVVPDNTYELSQGTPYENGNPRSKVEFRILDFTIVR